MRHFFGRIGAIILASLLLSGCFAADTQEYIVKKPASKVYKIISNLEKNGSLMGNYSEAANKIKVERSLNESVIFHFAGESDEPASIGFQFQSSKDGEATKVLVTYDIPKMSVGDGKKFGKSSGEYYVMPALVKRQFKKNLKKLFSAMADGKPYREDARDINLAFHAISLVTNPTKMQDMLNFDSSRFAALGNSFRDNGGRDYAGSASNIDAASERGFATDNAKPMSDARPMTDTRNNTLDKW
jgi:outer membrane murein-binding lipoprotein Lpp